MNETAKRILKTAGIILLAVILILVIYLHAVKSVENDCRYILQICAQVVGSILHLLQQNSMPLGCYM